MDVAGFGEYAISSAFGIRSKLVASLLAARCTLPPRILASFTAFCAHYRR